MFYITRVDHRSGTHILLNCFKVLWPATFYIIWHLSPYSCSKTSDKTESLRNTNVFAWENKLKVGLSNWKTFIIAWATPFLTLNISVASDWRFLWFTRTKMFLFSSSTKAVCICVQGCECYSIYNFNKVVRFPLVKHSDKWAMKMSQTFASPLLQFYIICYWKRGMKLPTPFFVYIMTNNIQKKVANQVLLHETFLFCCYW